jgi:OmpA-OmpF porin, OOP family
MKPFNMMRTLAILIFSLPLLLQAQNLVLNPGFEEQAGCPDKPGQIKLANSWSSPSIGTPDYFNDCSFGLEYGTEFNCKGGQVARSGKAYAGLQFHNLNRNEYFEYLQTMLSTALAPGQLYCISAWVSRGRSSYALKELGAIVSVTEVRSQNAHKLKLPFTSLRGRDYLTDQDQWMCITGIYKAKGNERLLTMGDFTPGDEFWHVIQRTATDSLFKSAYYFIDDVSVSAISDSSQCKCLAN